MMNIIHWTLQFIPPQYRALLRRVSYFLCGTVITVFYAQLVHAQSSGSRPITQTPYTVGTILVAIAGAVITILFLRNMYLVLTYASETYGLEEDNVPESDAENKALIFGAFGWIIGSAVIIASYGWSWHFLYIGQILCLLGPLVPTIAMNLDIKKYRELLAARAAAKRSPSSY